MLHLDFKLLRSFAAVASERSVTHAAERLNLTQPTVSGQIKELEQTLGFLLFHRTSRKVSLSSEGERLLPKVQSLLAMAEDLRHEAEAMKDAAARHFRLGAAMYTMDFADRAALLEAFATARPAIGYEIINRLQTDQVRDLLTDRLDAGLLLGIAADVPSIKFTHDRPAGRIVNEVQYPKCLERVVLSRRKIGLLVPQAAALAGYDIIPQAALAGQTIAMLGREHGSAVIDPLVNFATEGGAVLQFPAEGNALAVERHALRNNICAIGIGWFPAPGGMVWREVEGLDLHLEFALVLGTAANKAARQFFDFAQRWQDARAGQPMAVTPA
jgi:DNA-binding transcriptional LysR family regulator